MFILPAQPQSLKEVVLNSLRLYKTVILRLLPLSLLYALCMILPNMMIHFGPSSTIEAVSGVLKAHLALTALCGISSLGFLAMMFHQANQVMYHEDQSYTKSFLNALYRYPIYLISGFVFVVLAFAGLMLFVLPGIYLMILLIFYFPAIINDKKGIFESLRYSAKLVTNHWWRTLFILLVPELVGFVVLFLVERLGGLPLIYLSRFHYTEVSFYSHIIAIIVIAVINPWFTTAMLCQMHDLKLRQSI